MPRIPSWVVSDLAMTHAGGDGLHAAVLECSARYSVSKSTIYRRLQKLRGEKAKLQVSADEKKHVQLIAAHIRMSMAELSERTMSIENAISEMEIAGKIPAGTYSRNRVGQVMRMLGIHKANLLRPGPCVRLATKGPNHMHQADFTVSQMYYLENLAKEADEFRNAPAQMGRGWKRRTNTDSHGQTQTGAYIALDRELAKKQKTKVIIASLKDHYSGVIFAQAYEAEAESADVALRFLYAAWRFKSMLAFPLHGLPELLYVDGSGAWKKKGMLSLYRALGIRFSQHKKGNPRAKGSVENSMKDLAQFEMIARGRVKLGWKPSIEEFNQLMLEYCIKIGNREHVKFKGHTRFEIWNTIPDGQGTRSPTEAVGVMSPALRRCPEWNEFVAMTAIEEVARRVANDGTVSFGRPSKAYRIGTNLVGEFVHPYVAVDGKVWVMDGEGRVFEAVEGRNENMVEEDFAAPALTPWEEQIREMQRVAEKEGLCGPKLEKYNRPDDAQIYPLREGEESSKVQGFKGSRAESDGAGGADGYFGSETEAMAWIAEQSGQCLGDLPESTVKLISALLSSKTQNGLITREACREVVKVLSEEELGSENCEVRKEESGFNTKAQRHEEEFGRDFVDGVD